MLTHTPGPWHHDEHSDEIVAGDGEIVVASPADGYDEEQWRADAAVVAAAPELLAALRAFVALYADVRHSIGSTVRDMLTQGEAAIAKADGR